MKKQSEKFSDFFKSYSEVNYKDGDSIVVHLNKSINLFKRFEDTLDAGDDELAAPKLRHAGMVLYQACEWALKHYLYYEYISLFKSRKLNKKSRNQKIGYLDTPKANLYRLLNEFQKLSKDKTDEYEIDCDEILNNASVTNNMPKHSATVPNPEAYRIVLGEVKKIIIKFVDSSVKLDMLNDSLYGDEKAWYEIAEASDDFSDLYTYVLITNKVDSVDEKKLFSHKWDLVIDFDSETDINGFVSKYKKNYSANPWIRTLNPIESKKKFTSSNTPYWIMANGNVDDPSTIADLSKWRSIYGRHLTNLLEEFYSIYTKQTKVFIIPFENERVIEKIVDTFNEVYDDGNTVDFTIISPELEYARIEYDNFKKTNISLQLFCEKLCSYYDTSDQKYSRLEKKLPSINNEYINLNDFFLNELLDSFEVVHIDIADNKDFHNSKYDFYTGKIQIDWNGLKNNIDVVRKEKKIIYDKILIDMNDRGRLVKKVCYEPGIGGTTLMRRLAWELREQYPTLILKQLNEQTIRNIQKIYDLTKLPILIFVDSNNFDIDDVNQIQLELKKMGFAFLICYFERKFKGDKPVSGSVYTMLSKLTNDETHEMFEKLEEFADNEKVMMNLTRICNSHNHDHERSPFIMSMYTFEKDFKGIKPYISNFIEKINSQTLKILFAISLANYANSSIDIQYFIDLFDDEEIDAFLLKNNIGIHELVNRIDINGKKYLRIRYHTFAEEILCQISGGRDSTTISFVSLIDHILNFIEDSRKNYHVVKSEIVELLRDLFITRVADSDSEKPTFSPLITKLREETKLYIDGKYSGDKDAIIKIFNKLVKVYPEEVHFMAHLARYYFYIDKNYELGFEKINSAIELAETTCEKVDPLLYHMKGMGYSSRITNVYIKKLYKNHHSENNDENKYIIDMIQEDANEAFKYFELVRSSNIGNAGHLSDITLCIQVVNVMKNILDESEDFSEFITTKSGEWIIKYIDRAKNLFDECKTISLDDELEEIDTKIKAMSSSLEDSIDIWKNYLKSSKCFNKACVRRMLARSLQELNLSKNDTVNNQDNLKYIIRLMEENMTEESNQPGNIRIWFDAIKKLDSKNSEELIMDAIIKLNRWISISDDIEAHYYRFILKFLQAQNGSSLAESELPKLKRELKLKSFNLFNRTTIHHWLTQKGDGLEKLMINKRSRKNPISDEEMCNNMLMLVGRVSMNYVNDNNAYIIYRGVEVFFNPSATKGEIDKSKINQRVKFGIGFSYDGPRAYNSSIRLLDDTSTDIETRILECNLLVKCEVIKNVDYFTQVRIIGYDEIGSIHINELISPYTSDNRPRTGTIFDAKVTRKSYDNARSRELWQLSMKIDEFEDNESEIARQLRSINIFNSEN